MRIPYVFAMALGFALVGCESTTDSTDSTLKTKEAALVGKGWRPTSDIFDPGIRISGELITDNMSLRQDCDHDGTTHFAKDGTYSADEGATKCDESAPQTVDGMWTFNDKANQITMTEIGGEPQVYDIENLSDTSFTISKKATYWDESREHRQIFGFSSK
jgi:hypothetical protein